MQSAFLGILSQRGRTGDFPRFAAMVLRSRYVVAAFLGLLLPSQLAANILPNGDFSEGNSGFFSGYPYSDPFNGFSYHIGPIAPNGYRDHTTGTGNMLMADSTPGVAFRSGKSPSPSPPVTSTTSPAGA